MSPLWWLTNDRDLSCLDLYERHYSANSYAKSRETAGFGGPGERLTLRTDCGRALFVWRLERFRKDEQRGVNCAVFRNESDHLSSLLIQQADAIADEAWADSRHYTFVNTKKVASRNPGFCFLKAGWAKCGMTKGGLLVLERVAA